MERWVNVLGAGLAAEGVELRCGDTLDPAAVAGEERLAGLAIRAVHQAVRQAMRRAGSRVEKTDDEQLGLVYVSAWGSIDATVAYLESMLEAGGKHASPRHFSRSVYSAVASAVAIRFGIKGPSETLAFEREEAVSGALVAAWRLLMARRCERVIVVWAEQAAEIAEVLARRAATELGRKEYARYAAGLGEGAAAVVMGLEGAGIARVECAAARGGTWAGKPFAMDGAAGFVVGLVNGQ